MASFARGVFTPKNPGKYLGKNGNNIIYRSSWELVMNQYLDAHPAILGWGSEILSIPYINPLTKKSSNYIPDYFIVYVDGKSNKHVEVMEVKPAKEVPGFSGKTNNRTKLAQTINAAKWQAAIIYCVKRGWFFRIATEDQIFAYKRK